ncbi:PPE family protein, partial [Mycobacterium sp. ML5]
MSFAVLPPEINSARMYLGAGSETFLQAATAWAGLADRLGAAAASFSTVTTELVGSSWQGPASVAMTNAAAPYLRWLNAASAQAEQAAAQAQLAAAAFEAAQAATVHPGLIATNRARMVSLVSSNLLGLNTPAIAAAEAHYEQMWAQDVTAMFDYHARVSAAAAALTPYPPSLQSLLGLFGRTDSSPSLSTFAKDGLANIGADNLGADNLGSGNLGSGNLGNGNLGDNNVGSGNQGNNNFGPANSGDRNLGFGNAGDSNLGIANSGIGNIGLGNTGTGNIGIGLTGENQIGFGAVNSGSGNLGLFNSGSNNVGFFNSGSGNVGIGNAGVGNWGFGNSGAENVGIMDAGNYNTGSYNTGIANSGVVNSGSYNTGVFNTGDVNTGSFNAGSHNSGDFNTGNYNTGWFNSGDLNTGGFNSGSLNNGFFVSGDNRGQVSINLGISIPTVPFNFSYTVPINEVEQFGGNTVTIPGYYYSQTYFLNGYFYLGPINIPTSAITLPVVTINIGGPNTAIAMNFAGALEGRTIPILSIPGGPGFGNATTGPSSGFFNSGTGSSSGFGNFGPGNSGWQNVSTAALGNSGLQNMGALQSGVANLGNSISGFYNTGT